MLHIVNNILLSTWWIALKTSCWDLKKSDYSKIHLNHYWNKTVIHPQVLTVCAIMPWLFMLLIECWTKGEVLHALLCDSEWGLKKHPLQRQSAVIKGTISGFLGGWVCSICSGEEVRWPTELKYTPCPCSHFHHCCWVTSCAIRSQGGKMRGSFRAFWKLIPKALHLKTGNTAAPSGWPGAVCQLSKFFLKEMNTHLVLRVNL